jgi:hypothetical protein
MYYTHELRSRYGSSDQQQHPLFAAVLPLLRHLQQQVAAPVYAATGPLYGLVKSQLQGVDAVLHEGTLSADGRATLAWVLQQQLTQLQLDPAHPSERQLYQVLVAFEAVFHRATKLVDHRQQDALRVQQQLMGRELLKQWLPGADSAEMPSAIVWAVFSALAAVSNHRLVGRRGKMNANTRGSFTVETNDVDKAVRVSGAVCLRIMWVGFVVIGGMLGGWVVVLV